ncbi:MAG: glycosyl hydrolase, partial [Pirellulales bacterium]
EQATQHVAWTEATTRGPRPGTRILLKKTPVDTGPRSDVAGHPAAIAGSPALGSADPHTIVLDAPPHFTRDIALVAFPAPKQNVVARNAVIELALPAGREPLVWDVPAGDWIVRRLAMVDARSFTRVPPRGGEGLECDKLSKEAVQANFDGMVGRLLADNPKLAGRSIWGVESDSWEVGRPEWSPDFRDQFRTRRGYDPLPWLIHLKDGPIVENLALTNRFLYDWEQTKVDVFADHYFSNMQRIASRHKLKFFTEAYYGPFDPVTCAGRADVPMGEFWASGDCMDSMRWAASSSHVYGRERTAAEAFTGRPSDGAWAVAPSDLKRVGDLAFCHGLNMNIIHGYGLQPWDAKWTPGMPLGFWGTMITPRQTWWKPGRTWIDYLARCQHMLTQGHFVADLLFVFPSMSWRTAAPCSLHKQFNYDLCSQELLLEQLQFTGERFVLPSGMKYRLLVLPKFNGKAKPRVLRKLIRLTEAGGTVVVQDRPERSPSLENYPACDREVRRLAEKLWGACDGTGETRNRVGRGQLVWLSPWSDKEDPETAFLRKQRPRDPFFARAAHTVVWSKPLRTLLNELHVVPDVEVRAVRGQPLMGTAMAWGGRKLVPCGTREGEDVFAWTHRRSDEGDIYFVANQTAEPIEAELVFRVHGRQPEIWDPMTGNVQAAGTWTEEANRTVMPLFFTPFDSKFIVMRAPGKPSGEKGVHQANLFDPTRDGPRSITIQGDWEVTFPREDDAPAKIKTPLISWTDHPNEEVRFFSGTATYTKTFEVPDRFVRSRRAVYLDLGQVKNLAEVRLNGRELGVLWKSPFRLEVTGALQAGENRLALRVTNLWVNRMVGDEQYPDDCLWNPPQTHKDLPAGQSIREIPAWVWTGGPRPVPQRKTFTTWKFYTKETPLLPSGLLGPVRLVAVGEAPDE